MTWFCVVVWRIFQVILQFENNSSNWLGLALFSWWMEQFDEFFKWTEKSWFCLSVCGLLQCSFHCEESVRKIIVSSLFSVVEICALLWNCYLLECRAFFWDSRVETKSVTCKNQHEGTYSCLNYVMHICSETENPKRCF